MNAFIRYLQESIDELKLVRWPTRQQAVRLSVVVLLFSAVCAVAFGFVDTLLSQLIRFYLSSLL